jgi:bacterial/archaeal transporter family-2 protein
MYLENNRGGYYMAWVYVIIATLAGVCSATQAPINGGLGKRIGSLEAAWVSFFVGTVMLTLIVLFFGKGALGQFLQVPRWLLLGGLLGTGFVVFVIIAVPKLGVATTIIAVMSGQVISSILIDTFGWFGSPKIAFNGYRVAGAICLIMALFFLYRGTQPS